ncbi:hypothetical protein KPB06_31835 [Burkholderia semiarida]|nr:hypothetical protein [Burkholderia semiarida]MDF3104620.1 hypothetical protein [Burkholderia semiarida]
MTGRAVPETGINGKPLRFDVTARSELADRIHSVPGARAARGKSGGRHRRFHRG